LHKKFNKNTILLFFIEKICYNHKMGLNEEEGNSMDINSMRYFIAAAEHLNFTKAAHVCYITQTAMSAAIAKMEKELGATLFHRSNKKVELTEAGTVFLRQAEEIVRSYDDAIHLVRDAERIPDRDLTVFFSGGAEAALFAPTIRRFRRKYPEAKLNVKIAAADRLCARILREPNAVAVTAAVFDSGDEPEISSVPVTSYVENIFMEKHHPLAGRMSISPEELQNETIVSIRPENISKNYEPVRAKLEQAALTAGKTEYRDTLSDVYLALLYEGRITALPSYYEQISPDAIVSVPVRRERPILIPLSAYYPKDRLTPEIKALLAEAHLLPNHFFFRKRETRIKKALNPTS
jgi:DNA-binding transcriptional LysR family regulator